MGAAAPKPLSDTLLLLCSIDGRAAQKGIWVKGVVKGMAKVEGEVRYTVEHTNWEDRSETTMTTAVYAADIRQSYP